MFKQIPPFLLGEVEWPDAITSGDLLFHIPVQLAYDGMSPTDITGNYTVSWRSQVSPFGDPTGVREFRITYDASLDAISKLHNELFWDDATKTPKWIDATTLGAVYKGINYIFQDNKSGGDLLCFATQRTSSTSPSIEQVAAYLSLDVQDVFSFDGTHFKIGGVNLTI